MEKQALLITGANGHLGQRLIIRLLPEHDVIALVRSERAQQTLHRACEQLPAEQQQRLQIRRGDPGDPAAVAEALVACDAVIHLVGVIKESRQASYQDVHEKPARILSEAAHQAGVKRIVYLSILGAAPDASSHCLRSRHATEQIFANSAVPCVNIRVPMVLGPGDYATAALKSRATRRFNLMLRASSMEQPIFADDVLTALCNALTIPIPSTTSIDGAATGGSLTLQLAGPQALSRAAFTQTAAQTMGGRTTIMSLPFFLGYLFASVLERILANPPVTADMLKVLDHDDEIDPLPDAKRLGLTLTPLKDTLQKLLHR